ncbi:MAG TPA: aromatic amino acid ammonia-lyase [Steroidobacteraceae bacterium]|nr:aromatic amino acid ammonia-lyase [Steroidobacteraceae bacterium]
MSGQTVVLTGHDLTLEQLVAVARYGAHVKYSDDALKRAQDMRDLRAEAGAENIPVYGLNRGAGALREVKKAPEQSDTPVLPMLGAGGQPEIPDEDLVRAVMLIGANTAPLGASDPQVMQLIIDLLNNRITPVAFTRGTLGQADFPAVSNNIHAAMTGHGEVYYKGVRMKAAQALAQAKLKALTGDVFFVGAENAYGDARAALLAVDGRLVLEWADLIYALDKLGMDSSITPMVSAVQAARPFKWVNWDAARIMDILQGSYLFEREDTRILQDPQSMRASYIRDGSAWQAWAALRDSVLMQINSADLNPLVIVGASPSDSKDLATPQMMRFYVKGGPLSHGLHGYVFSTANWDPYPMANDMEAFTNALANMDAAVAQRIERFTDRGPTAFFTGIYPKDVLTPEQIKNSPALSEPFWVFMDFWQEIQSLSTSLVPEGNAADLGVADIEGQTRLKGMRGQQVVDLTYQLLGYDLWNATYWLDVRKAQNSTRGFGPVPTAVWMAFRKQLPWQQEPEKRPEVPYGIVAYSFLKSTPASTFYPAGPPMPGR